MTAFAESLHSVTYKIGTPLRELERQAIEIALAHTRGNKPMAARLHGVGPRTIYRHLDANANDHLDQDSGDVKDPSQSS